MVSCRHPSYWDPLSDMLGMLRSGSFCVDKLNAPNVALQDCVGWDVDAADGHFEPSSETCPQGATWSCPRVVPKLRWASATQLGRNALWVGIAAATVSKQTNGEGRL